MRRLTFAVAAALAFAMPVAVSAQTPPAAAPKPGPVARVIRASLAHITPTDAEKTRLAAVRGVYAPKFKLVNDAMQPIRLRMKAAAQARDTAAFRAARLDLRKARAQGVDVLRGTLVDVRAALDPEHQAQFDKNVVRVRNMIRRRFGP